MPARTSCTGRPYRTLRGLLAGRPEAEAVRLCLNMIVRNESAIIEHCLTSVLPYLSCYVVCDTGSTDDTAAIIGRVLAGLPGEVHSLEFRNFEQARNEALDLARRSNLAFDYLLLIDADMELKVVDPGFAKNLTHPGYLVRQVAGSTAYHNIRLLARETPARYVGVTHEYLETGVPPVQLEGILMLDHACGSSRAEKTERDLALLSWALEKNPNDARSLFYLAQTLREAGRYQEAIAAYRRRMALEGWEEEVWYSAFMIARCHQAEGNLAEFVAGCLDAYQLRPSRAEPLHALAQHYRITGRNEASALFCEAGLPIPRPPDLLFVDEEIYRTGFRQELSISGYYCSSPERRALARRYTAELATERQAAPWVRENARANWKHYARSADGLFPSTRFHPLELSLPEGYHPCNPTLAWKDGILWCVLRTVNYSLDGGLYRVGGDGVIRSRNYLLGLDRNLQPVSSRPIREDPPQPEHPVIDGLEDIRLTAQGGCFRGSATIVDATPDYRRRIAVFDLHEDGRVTNLTPQTFQAEQDQKNWVPFLDQGQLGFIYWCDPTVVLRWDERSRQSLPELQQPCPLALENLRGSSGAIAFDDGWLYVAHEVSHIAGERTYLHRFVQLHGNFQVRAVSEPFYFRVVGIEFCCGMVEGPGPGQLVLSFGVQDSQAWLAILEAEEVRRGLVPCP